MIITKKEFKDAVKKVIIEAVKETRDPNFTDKIMKNGYTTKKKHLITQIQS